MSWYCAVARNNPVHAYYHDVEYGFPTDDERVLFERLALEIFQAGLSWELILKKRQGMVDAFEGFDVNTVASYGERDINRLLADPGIIRNRLKITSLIENARRLQVMRDACGGFASWLASNHPRNRKEWTKTFRKTLKFTGGEIVNEFLMSVGYLPGAHHEDCPVYGEIARLRPPWSRVDPAIYASD